MLRHLSAAFTAVVLFICVPASAQTVDELIAKSVQAKGGLDKIKAVQSLRMTGTMTMGSMDIPIVLEVKRPNSVRMDMTVQGMVGTTAYDGKTAWMLMPFMGAKDPQLVPPDEQKALEEQADFDGPLMDYKAKGNTIELMGKEPVEGADAYKLKVTLKNGDVQYIYLDADQYLEVRQEGKRIVRGSEMDTETVMSDYKAIDGLMFPHSIVTGPKGAAEKQKMVVQKIEINPQIDEARFKMPEVKKEAPKEVPKD